METHHITPARGLSETGLKWVALVTMVLDHIHYFFSFTGCVPEWFSMVGRLGAPLFLFCLVEGFTHTRSRKRYFARVYVLSTAMSLLFFFMAFAHVLVRPDGFYPANGMMTTFVILMVMFQGIDWLGRRHIVRGLAALLLPLAWPFLASALSLAVPALATPVGLAAYSVLPAWGTTGDSSWPVLAMGLVLYLFRRNRRGQVLAFAVFYFLYGVVYMGLMASQMPDFAWSQLFTRYYEIYGILAAPLMLCYNGQRGGGHKRLFYAFYPAHIYILYALSWGLYILVVDDDGDLRALLKTALERDGHQVSLLDRGGAVSEAHCRWADCILLDVMMPGEDGFATCRRIRALAACPILFLTAKTEEADVLTGLGLGGDDYLSKPFRIAELRARVAAHLRRESRAPRSRIRRGGLDFDLEERAVYCGEEPLHLTRGEYAICAHLAAHPAQTFTKEQIYEAVFGFDGTADSSAITEHIKNIRAKLRAVGLSPIQTVWGVGYKWESA